MPCFLPSFPSDSHLLLVLCQLRPFISLASIDNLVKAVSDADDYQMMSPYYAGGLGIPYAMGMGGLGKSAFPLASAPI